MSFVDTIRDHVSEHQEGMLADLCFAICWVSVVSALFAVVDGPQWASYMTMVAGVPAYFGFVWSLASARDGQ